MDVIERMEFELGYCRHPTQNLNYDTTRCLVYTCMYMWLGNSRSFKQVLLNSKDKFCLYNLIIELE